MKSMCFDFLIVGVIIGMFIGAAIMQRKLDKDTIIPEADLDTNYCDNVHIFDNTFMTIKRARYVYDCIYFDGNEYAQSELNSDSPFDIIPDDNFHEVVIEKDTVLLKYKRIEYTEYIPLNNIKP